MDATNEEKEQVALVPQELAAKSQPQSPATSDKGEEHIEIGEWRFVHGIHLILILAPTTFIYCLVMLDGSILSVAIPAITSEFDSLLDIGWYV